MTTEDVAALILRLALGGVMIAHGYNHLFGAGGVAGTARWFRSIGLRPPRLHAWASGLVEIGAGLGLLLGLVTPLCCAAVIGVGVIAGIAVHRKNGFFVFRDGYEYVLTLSLAAFALAILGPGRLSLDHLLGLVADGALGSGLALIGLIAAVLLLAMTWRPGTAARDD